MNEKNLASAHWSFWLISAVGLVFNLMGCANYVWQLSPENVASMPDVYRTIVESRPAWGTAAFAFAVFGGALGCLLLLFRKSIALYVLVIALLGALVAQLPYLASSGFPMSAWAGWLSQAILAVFLVWYSRYASRRRWIA